MKPVYVIQYKKYHHGEDTPTVHKWIYPYSENLFENEEKKVRFVSFLETKLNVSPLTLDRHSGNTVYLLHKYTIQPFGYIEEMENEETYSIDLSLALQIGNRYYSLSSLEINL